MVNFFFFLKEMSLWLLMSKRGLLSRFFPLYLEETYLISSPSFSPPTPTVHAKQTPPTQHPHTAITTHSYTCMVTSLAYPVLPSHVNDPAAERKFNYKETARDSLSLLSYPKTYTRSHSHITLQSNQTWQKPGPHLVLLLYAIQFYPVNVSVADPSILDNVLMKLH